MWPYRRADENRIESVALAVLLFFTITLEMVDVPLDRIQNVVFAVSVLFPLIGLAMVWTQSKFAAVYFSKCSSGIHFQNILFEAKIH